MQKIEGQRSCYPEIGWGVPKNVYGKGISKPRGVRQLSSATMTDAEIVRQKRLDALREATNKLLTQDLSDQDWADILKQLNIK